MLIIYELLVYTREIVVMHFQNSTNKVNYKRFSTKQVTSKQMIKSTIGAILLHSPRARTKDKGLGLNTLKSFAQYYSN